MIREHLNIEGGWHWLPFLRAQVRKFEDVAYASQQYIFPDSATGRFTKENDIVHIYLESNGAWVAWAPDVEIVRSEATYRVAVAPPLPDPPAEPEYAPEPERPTVTVTSTTFGWAIPGLTELVGSSGMYELRIGSPGGFMTGAPFVIPEALARSLDPTYEVVISEFSGNIQAAYSRRYLLVETHKYVRVVQEVMYQDPEVVTTLVSTIGEGSRVESISEYASLVNGFYPVVRDNFVQESRWRGLSSYSYNGVAGARSFDPPLDQYVRSFVSNEAAVAAWQIDVTAIQQANLALHNAWIAAVAAYELAWPDTVAAYFLAARLPQRARQQDVVGAEIAAGLASKYLAGGIWFDYTPKRQRATPLFIRQVGYTAYGAEGGAITYEVTDYSDRERPETRELVGTWAVAALGPVASSPAYGTTGSSLFTLDNVLPDVAARTGFDTVKPWSLPGDYFAGQLISGTQENFDSAQVQRFTYTSPEERSAWAKIGDMTAGIDPIAPGAMVRRGSKLFIVALEYETFDLRFTNHWQWMSAMLWQIDPILPMPPETSVPDSPGTTLADVSPRAVRSVAIYEQKYDFVDADDHTLGMEWKATKIVPLPRGAQHFFGSILGVERVAGELGDATQFPLGVFVLLGVGPTDLPLDKLDDAVVTVGRVSADPALWASLSGDWDSIATVQALRDRLTMEALQLLKLVSKVAP
ncbi:MAG: hypothetical protein Q8N51_05845 [Gammaproteobacteria bacterium]|nr:hypothetical protein [Gammaproteobacteria bacterium]